MDMGSAKCLNRSTMADQDFNEREDSGSTKKKKSQMCRPKFYPCSKCGRKFTMLALAIHNESCNGRPDCCCNTCRAPSSGKSMTVEIIEPNGVESGGTTNGTNSSAADLEEICVSQSNSPTIENNTLMQLAFVVSQTQPFPIDNSDLQSQEIVASNSTGSPSYFVIDKNNEQCVSADSSPDFSGLLLLHDAGILSLSGDKEEAMETNTAANTGEPPIPEDCKGTIIPKIVPNLSETKVEVISGPSSNYTFSDRQLLCTLCNLELPWEVFGSHIVQHSVTSDPQIMKCPKCLKIFTRSAMLLIHFYKHVTDCPFICKDCLTMFRLCEELKRHTLNIHGYVETQPFHCYICMRRFSHPQTIINHMRLHSKETPFKCKECSRSFSQIGNLQRHLSVHRGDRPHKCQECDKSFADPATLRNHVRIHTGETPFVCKVCLRGFTQVGNLKRHMARHLQARPKTSADNFTQIDPSSLASEDDRCDDLSETGDAEEAKELMISGAPLTAINGDTRSEMIDSDNDNDLSTKNDFNEALLSKENETALAMSQLKEQRKKHHWQLFPCPVCGKVYTWQHDLSIHFRIHTGEKPYKCDICDKRFAQSGAVRIHKARHHNDEDVYVGS